MMNRDDIIHAARPLRWIFWGALLVLADVILSWTSGPIGFRLDILDDTVGMLLITAAVGRLQAILVDASYARRMRFIRWVSLLALLDSILQHFIFPKPGLLTFLLLVLGVAMIAAFLSFCACMRDLCRAATLDEAARMWDRTLVVFVLFYGIPGIGLVLFGLAALVDGRTYQLDVGPGTLLIGLLFLVPLFYFFTATKQMARAAEAMPAATVTPAPLPGATAVAP